MMDENGKTIMETNLEKKFDLEPREEVIEAELVTTELKTIGDSEYEADFNKAKKVAEDLVEIGMKSIHDLSELTRSTESMRAFEALNDLLKTVSDISKEPLDLQERKKMFLNEPEPEQTNVTNNNVFIGSTSELQKMIGEINKED